MSFHLNHLKEERFSLLSIGSSQPVVFIKSSFLPIVALLLQTVDRTGQNSSVPPSIEWRFLDEPRRSIFLAKKEGSKGEALLRFFYL